MWRALPHAPARWRAAAAFLTVFPVLAGLPAGLSASEPRPLVVAIDAGHGGKDPGAMVEGLVEKDIVLDFAKVLAARLAAEPGIEPRLIRSDDSFLPLGDRIRAVQAANADVLLSIHADTVEWGNAQGLSIYTLSDTGRERAREALTERTPRDAVLGGIDLGGAGDDVTRVLVDLAQRGSLGEGEALVEATIAELSPDVKLLRTRPHRRANFFVLRSPDTPSVLIELGFMSNAEDRARLADPAWRAMVAGRIARGIVAWRDGARAEASAAAREPAPAAN